VACCFAHQVDALCLAHRAVELLGIVGSILVLEKCVIGVVIDLVIVLFLNTGME
jgi:hypothetical protein